MAWLTRRDTLDVLPLEINTVVMHELSLNVNAKGIARIVLLFEVVFHQKAHFFDIVRKGHVLSEFSENEELLPVNLKLNPLDGHVKIPVFVHKQPATQPEGLLLINDLASQLGFVYVIGQTLDRHKRNLGKVC